MARIRGHSRQALRATIRRALGHPFVKVELCDEHLDDAIDAARDNFIMYAVGNATQERWLTLLLKNGKWLYDLPSGVTEVVDYRDEFGAGGVNNTLNSGGPSTLFSVDNAMYMSGFLNYYDGGYGGGNGLEGGYNPGTAIGSNGVGMGVGAFNPISVELSKQMMGDMEHYHVNRYNWHYHRSTNQLELQPLVPCDSSKMLTIRTDLNGNLTTTDNPINCSTLSATTTASTFMSPGFVLLRTYMVEGSGIATWNPPTSGNAAESIYDIHEDYSDWIYAQPWVMDYATALAKQNLGIIRRKFAGYGSMGGQGISLDGDSLVSEGKEEADKLMEELDLKYAYEGYGIVIG